MSIPVFTVDDPQAATGKEAPSPQDGWRAGGLPALRAELDRIDNTVHDLLIQRAEIVEQVAHSGKPAAFRPGREASIIRRLIGRHRGALPPVTLVRIWRELLAGTTSMQGGFSIAVCDADHGGPLSRLAREHFGALTPLRAFTDPNLVLADVSRGIASVAVLPQPSDLDTWWVTLLHHEPRLYIVGRLPFWEPRPDGFPAIRALVVASAAPDASEKDRSFLGFELATDCSPALLSSELATAGLKSKTMVLARQQGSSGARVLVEVEGYLSEDDTRLGCLGSNLRRPLVLGSYAVPVAGDAV